MHIKPFMKGQFRACARGDVIVDAAGPATTNRDSAANGPWPPAKPRARERAFAWLLAETSMFTVDDGARSAGEAACISQIMP